MQVHRNWVISTGDVGLNWSSLLTYQRNEIIAQHPDLKEDEIGSAKWDCTGHALVDDPRPLSDAEGRTAQQQRKHDETVKAPAAVKRPAITATGATRSPMTATTATTAATRSPGLGPVVEHPAPVLNLGSTDASNA